MTITITMARLRNDDDDREGLGINLFHKNHKYPRNKKFPIHNKPNKISIIDSTKSEVLPVFLIKSIGKDIPKKNTNG